MSGKVLPCTPQEIGTLFLFEKLTPEQILKRELATGVPIIYRLKTDSTVETKEILAP